MYQTWKLAAQATLDVDDLWDIFAGTEKKEIASKVDILNRKAKSKLIIMVGPVYCAHIS